MTSAARTDVRSATTTSRRRLPFILFSDFERWKKRKKKVYTTPKVIKHKHKTVKLAVLKFYSVGGAGKITKECPAEQCGAGVFMAQHKDRYYCGKCGLTYRIKE